MAAWQYTAVSDETLELNHRGTVLRPSGSLEMEGRHMRDTTRTLCSPLTDLLLPTSHSRSRSANLGMPWFHHQSGAYALEVCKRSRYVDNAKTPQITLGRKTVLMCDTHVRWQTGGRFRWNL